MIVVLVNSGQMCNQLLTLASAYSIGLEYNINVLCPVMNESLKDFFCFARHDESAIKVEMYHSDLWGMVSKSFFKVRRLLKISSRKTFDIEHKSKNQYFFNWVSFKDDAAFRNHQTEIRDYFRFKDSILNVCKERMINVVDPECIKIGVHMRRGDYKEFSGGKWYYSDSEYAKWMKALNSEKKIQFLLFSNEEINAAYFNEQGLNVSVMNGSGVEDLCCLSMCDYIMGPPSTYSWWASMYGNVKRLILLDRNVKYDFNDFLLLEERPEDLY